MKRIYLVLVLTIFLGFVAGNKASGQDGCEVCAGYGLYQYCYVLDFQLPGCTPSRAVFCYDISNCPNGITIQVVELESDPDCEDASWDYVYQWVKANIQSLCGNKPCDEPPPTTVYYSVPICGRVTWLGTVGPKGRVINRAYPGPCDKRCTFVLQICTQNGEKHIEELGHYITGNGNCEIRWYGNTDLTGGHPVEEGLEFELGKIWTLDCVRVSSKYKV